MSRNGEWKMENGECRMPIVSAPIFLILLNRRERSDLPAFSILNSQFSIPFYEGER
jgi:hypothetical protein